jgi:hypothetical protein
MVSGLIGLFAAAADMSDFEVDSNTLSAAFIPSSGNNDPNGNTVDAWSFAFKAAQGTSAASTAGQSVSQSATQNPSDYLNQTRCIGLCHGFDPGMKPLATPHQLLPLHVLNLAVTSPFRQWERFRQRKNLVCCYRVEQKEYLAP